MIKKLPFLIRSASAAVATAMILALAACGTIDIASGWRTEEIVVDGRSGDWGGHLRAVEKTPYAIGVLNDGENLYVCLRGDAESGTGGFERSGLIVWLDPTGGKQKYLGVRFPIGMDMQEFQGQGQPFNDPSMGDRRRPPQPGGPPEVTDAVEILGPGRDESARFRHEELKGVEVQLTRSPGGFVYELKVPLKKSEASPIAVEVPPPGIVGIGFEPGDAIGGMMGNRGMGGPTGGMGGMGGRGGMPGGPGGMGGGRGAMNGAEVFKAWLRVTLAKPQAVSKN
jgi:hypothetical protein